MKYELTDEEARSLTSKSKTARKFFSEKFPGSSIRRVYLGTVYEKISDGELYIFSRPDSNSVSLISLANGNRYSNPAIVSSAAQHIEGDKIWFSIEDVDKVFGNPDRWTKVEDGRRVVIKQ